MSSKTKIFVLHMKEIIYTAIFVILGILLILLLIFMFYPESKRTSHTEKQYTPGTYSSAFSLNSMDLEMEVTVDRHKITAIRCVNLNETTTAMYPLLQPAVEDIADQVCRLQSTDSVVSSKENPYTSKMIIHAIENALKKAVAD